MASPLSAINVRPQMVGMVPSLDAGNAPLAFSFLDTLSLAEFSIQEKTDLSWRKKFASHTNSSRMPTKLTYPTADVERLRWYDPGARCISINQTVITSQPKAFELTRVVLPNFGTGVIESIATFWEIDSLNDSQVPFFTFSSAAAGVDPCNLPIISAFGGIAPLDMRFYLVAEEIPSYREIQSEYPVMFGIPSSAMPRSDQVIPSWADNRYGWESRYTTDQQFVVGGRVLLRMFAVIRADDQEQWAVRKLSGRLQGYTQRGGTMGAALRSAIERR